MLQHGTRPWGLALARLVLGSEPGRAVAPFHTPHLPSRRGAPAPCPVRVPGEGNLHAPRNQPPTSTPPLPTPRTPTPNPPRAVNHAPARNATRDLLTQLTGRSPLFRGFNTVEVLLFFVCTLGLSLVSGRRRLRWRRWAEGSPPPNVGVRTLQPAPLACTAVSPRAHRCLPPTPLLAGSWRFGRLARAARRASACCVRCAATLLRPAPGRSW